MTAEQITSAWSAPNNAMTPVEARSLTAAFVEEVRARRKRSSLGLAMVAAAFAALSGLSVAAIVTQDDLGAKQAWMFAAMNALIWGGWIVALVKHLAPERSTGAATAPVRDALRRALEQRRKHLGHLRIIAAGLLLSTPLVAWSLHQMVEAGRLAPADVPQRIALAMGAYAVAFACLGSDYFGRSTQEVESLQSLLADCEREAPVATEETA